MSKKTFILFSVLVLVIGAVISVIIIGYILRPKESLLVVESEPAAKVYVDSEFLGTTPLEKEIAKKNVTVKLVPEDEHASLLSYEAKINLTRGVKTIVRRNLGETREEESGVIISFEKINTDDAYISVVTVPDGSEVILDNIDRDSSPVKFDNVLVGQHSLLVKAEGYQEKETSVVAEKGYILTAIIDLKFIGFPKPSPTPEPTPAKKMVTVKETPTNFLRVRSEPNLDSDEVSKIFPSEEYELLEESEDKKWLKIRLNDAEEGWVTSEFATISGETGI